MLHSDNLLGIDIGACSIKVALFKGSFGSYTLKAAACLKLPEEGGAAAPATPGFLRDALSSMRISAKRTSCLLSGDSLIFRNLHLPVMPEKDLKEAVNWEMRKEAGIPAGEAVSDYILSGDGSKKDENKLSILGFAARRSDAEKTMAFYREAGLDPRVIEVKPTALLSAYNINNEWEVGANYALLDIGEAHSTLVILKDKTLVFARDISFGGRDLTRSLSAIMTPQEAEEYKITYGLKGPDGAGEAGPLAATVEGMCSELQRSFDYYQAQFRMGPVSKLFLSGGTARLKGIDGFIGRLIGVPCFPDDPFRKVKISRDIDADDLGRIAPCMTIAAGLAARVAQRL